MGLIGQKSQKFMRAKTLAKKMRNFLKGYETKLFLSSKFTCIKKFTFIVSIL
jgi:hypothetical protein